MHCPCMCTLCMAGSYWGGAKYIDTLRSIWWCHVLCSGDVRNDIYITVESGVFEKGKKRSERNVEVAIEVFDGLKNVIPVS